MSNYSEMTPMRASRYTNTSYSPIIESFIALIGVGIQGGKAVGGILGGTVAVCLPFLAMHKLYRLL
jgi:hypothetical protein